MYVCVVPLYYIFYFSIVKCTFKRVYKTHKYNLENDYKIITPVATHINSVTS